MLSMRGLGLPNDIVSVFRKADAPPQLQEIDLDGRVKTIYVVPTKLATTILVKGYRYVEQIRGGTAYAI